MAMLAEPRRKIKYGLQSYTSLSKSNKRVDGNTNSFGYKMMASMGWAPGKGLGANESGEVDPIKLRLKNDAAGVGFKISEHDALAQQTEFQSLLQQLNSNAVNGEDLSMKTSDTSGKVIIKSLEKLSEQSSRRVHYKKFTRGKDLSRASEKDLRSILGITSLEAPVKEADAEAEVPVAEEISEEPQSDMYITAGSSEDYFKDKFAAFKKRKISEEDASAGTDSNELSNTDPKKRRSVTWGDVDVSYVDKYINDIVDTSGSVNESFNSSFCVEEPPVKKSKKKKKREGFVAENPEDSIQQIEVLAQTCERKKKKKKKSNSEEILNENSDIQYTDHSVPKKKKKKERGIKEEQNPSQEEEMDFAQNVHASSNGEEVISTNIEPPIKQKKKKKKTQDVIES